MSTLYRSGMAAVALLVLLVVASAPAAAASGSIFGGDLLQQLRQLVQVLDVVVRFVEGGLGSL